MGRNYVFARGAALSLALRCEAHYVPGLPWEGVGFGGTRAECWHMRPHKVLKSLHGAARALYRPTWWLFRKLATTVAITVAAACASPTAPKTFRASMWAVLPDSLPWLYAEPVLTVTAGDSTLRATPSVPSRCVVWSATLPMRVHFGLHFSNTSDSVWADFVAPFPKDAANANVVATLDELFGPGNGLWAMLRTVATECGA